MQEAQSLEVLWNRKIPKKIVISAPTAQSLISWFLWGLLGNTVSADTKLSVSQMSKSSPGFSGRGLHFSKVSTGMLVRLYSEL